MTSAPSVITVGETLATLRAEGPLRLGGPMRLTVAGSESNTAIGLARLGVPVGWVGVVGGDELGALVLRTLRAEGVDVEGARVEASAPTALMFLEPRLGHVNRVTYRRTGSAGSTLRPADIEAALARRPRWMHLSGITPALSPSAREAAEYACRTAAATGTRICLDVNYRSALWSRPDARRALAGLAAQAQMVLASADELELVSPLDGPGPEEDHAAALLAAGAGEVVVTRGGEGATAYSPRGALHRPALPVTVVDTVGAGDAFAAGYLASTVAGEEPATRLETAVATAAFAVSCAGDWEGLPTRAELPLIGIEAGETLR